MQAAFPQAAIWAGIILGPPSPPGPCAAAVRRPSSPAGLLALAAHTLLVVGLLGARGSPGGLGNERGLYGWERYRRAASAFFIVPLYALFHARTVDAFRGRFWGLEGALRTAAMCAGYFTAGALAQRLPLVAIFIAIGVVLCVLGVVVVRVHASPVVKERSAAAR